MWINDFKHTKDFYFFYIDTAAPSMILINIDYAVDSRFVDITPSDLTVQSITDLDVCYLLGSVPVYLLCEIIYCCQAKRNQTADLYTPAFMVDI